MPELVGLGGAAAIVSAGGLLLWRYIRVILNAQDRRLRELEEANVVCNLRVDMLLAALRQEGIAVPEALWTTKVKQETKTRL